MIDREAPYTLEDGWLSTKALAGRLGVCELTVRRWAQSGRLPPPMKLGRSVRWPWGQVIEWVANRA
jgi:excisionase family DNA binding protein